ncbi:MAG: N-acetylmuramoyl-L-alanine amidase [Clostridiaceae bacterium]|nr:N-acetylmuramoyl-L-alanine amidase [Clostridiaceae bacterium]
MKKKRSAFPKVLFILPVLFLALAAFFLLFNREEQKDFKSDGILKVCLDPGHGLDDPGAKSSDGLRLEKDDCLKLALAVKDKLSESWPEIEVVMTRDSDTYPTLEERCSIANDSDSDIFVSIHRNSADGASGTEVWIKSSKPEIDKDLAKKILAGLDSVGISSNRGVRNGTANNPESDYYVNKNTDMPSCLIELGFITSEKDNELFDKNFDDYAKAIAKAIAKELTA